MGVDLARQAIDGVANLAGEAPDAGRSQLAVVLRAVGEQRAAEALLASRAAEGLLPQPGGFEGLVSCPELAASRDLPAPDRVEGGVGQVRLDAAQLGAAADPQDHDDFVFRWVDQL